MQVFRLYFKVLRKYIGSIIMYASIFLGIVLGVIIPQVTKNNSEEYTQKKAKFAVFDNDNSELSKGLVAYLKENHALKTIKDDDTETIQDELYNTNVDCVIRFNDGFEEAFLAGDTKETLEIFEIPNTNGAVLFKQNLNSYLSTVDTYVAAGFDVSQACEKTTAVSETKIDVQFVSEGETGVKGVQYYYSYLAWVFIAMCVESLAAVLLSLGKKEVKNRIECSPYKFVRMNLETVLGVMVTGFVICVVCVVMSFVAFPEDMAEIEGILYILNAFCMMAVALSLTFIISKLTENRQIISLLTNILGLGMAFLCGVFVPMEVLSDTVIKIAHFLPVYWNVKAVNLIAVYDSSDLITLLSYMGIQILFAVAIICVGMVVARRKRGIVA